MKNQKKMQIAFILNLVFAVFETIGGLLTGSVAILSDAIHDAGDAASIGISWSLEKKSLGKPDQVYTYGYARFSLLGSLITHAILLFGSLVVALNAVYRLLHPIAINYDGMILLAIVGIGVNLVAALITHGGGSLNLKAVNLHLIEDVLGWIVVLVGAVIMRLTNFAVLDPLMSLGVAVFIGWMSTRGLRDTLEVLLEKVPRGISVSKLLEKLAALDGVEGVHHLHVRSLDGHTHCATVHIVTDGSSQEIRSQIREVFYRMGIAHVTVEIESPLESCCVSECLTETPRDGHRHSCFHGQIH